MEIAVDNMLWIPAVDVVAFIGVVLIFAAVSRSGMFGTHRLPPTQGCSHLEIDSGGMASQAQKWEGIWLSYLRHTNPCNRIGQRILILEMGMSGV